MANKPIAINLYGKDWRGRELARCTDAWFFMEGIMIRSVEGFVQGIKFPPEHSKREKAFKCFEGGARDIGKGAKRRWVWWKGKRVKYGSPKHYEYIERAFRARLSRDAQARLALGCTAGSPLVYMPSRGEYRMSLRAKQIAAIFTNLRTELTKTGEIRLRKDRKTAVPKKKKRS